MPTGPPPYTLLVVEDEPSIRFAMREYFGAQGWLVVCAASTGEAREALANCDVDVAVLDLRLGVDDRDGGLELADWISRSFPRARTILLTGYGSNATRARAHQAGVAEVLDKPMRLPVLGALARRLIEDAPR
jgi:DNA-binding NtrC family response regulator